jgi:3-hydroxyisobutyrate dehydrogenase-like beta-hydroxyacid dehydrogenase
MVAGTMTAVLEAIRDAMGAGLPEDTARHLAQKTAAALKPLVARAGAVINGDAEPETGVFATPQHVVDQLLMR